MSDLPDAILVSIISQLTAREATAMSILSTRWRHLHAYMDRLVLIPLEVGTEGYQKMLSNYSNMVSRTMDSHKGASIKELVVVVPACNDHEAARLIEFALSKKVEKMNISIMQQVASNNDLIRVRVWDNLVLPLRLPHLKELSLSGVCLDDDDLALVLSNSPHLECLSISDSLSLRNVSIVGLIKLKHVDVSNSAVLRYVEVVDTINLVSLRCYRIETFAFILKLDNVPKLTELGISEGRRNHVPLILSRIPPCVHHQLQTLRLWTSPPHIWIFTTLPKLINVRHLEVVVGQIGPDDRPFPLFRLIEACTCLEKLEIKLLGQPEDPYIGKFRERKIIFRAPTRELSPNIKKLKVSGYTGRPVESELVMFVVKNVATLHEFVIELCGQTPRIRRRAQRCARKYFRRIAPNSIDVTII